MTLPTNIIAGNTGHISHTNTVHAKINELLDLDGELSELVSPVSGDRIYVERASDGAHFFAQVGNLPGGGGGGPGSDTTAIHDDTAAEISAITEKLTPVAADLLIMEDSAAGNAKKRVQIGNLPTGSDADAIHDNVAGEIAAIAAVTVASGDFLVVEDIDDSNNKGRVTAGAIAALASGSNPNPSADDEILMSNAASDGWAATRTLVNVCSPEFGADPTGSSDSAAAFREAVDWIDTNRGGFGTIYVPHGHYNFTTTETVSVRGTNRDVHVHIHEGIHVVGAGFGSGRSQGSGDNQLAPTTIRSTSGTPWAIFLMHATGDVPDWRGASIRQLHIKDDSASNNAVDHAIVVSGGLIYSHIENVSISNIEKSTGWAIRYVRANNNQPSQYGRITDVIISRCYNGIWLDGNAPDMIMTRISALRDGLSAGNGTGLLIESSKVTVRDSEVQFFDVGIDVTNAGDNRGKHLLFDNIHIEGDQGEPADTYAHAFRMVGTSGQDELPLLRNIDLGNQGTYASWFDLTNVEEIRMYDIRIRDVRWMGPTSGESKFTATTSTGLIDGVNINS